MRRNSKRKSVLAGVFSRRWLLVNAGCVLLCLGGAFALSAAFKNAEYFTVREVIIREKDDITNGESTFAYFKGKNIFRFDLSREAARIALSYPSYRKIRLTRFLPDIILVDFLRRKPVASVRAQKGCYIDENAYLFDQPGAGEPSDLPVITGLDRKVSQARLGRPLALRETALALQVIRGMSAAHALSAYRIASIDVSELENLEFTLMPPRLQAAADSQKAKEKDASAGIEVRLGPDNVPGKMQILATVLTQMRSTLPNIKYIDLRFREPVIKFRNMDKFSSN